MRVKKPKTAARPAKTAKASASGRTPAGAKTATSRQGPAARTPAKAAAPSALPPRKSGPETIAILDALATQHPNAWTELDHGNAFELLVATILSAQSSDQRVNGVTPAFFARYPDAASLASATTAELEPQIVPTGFFRQKAKMLQAMARLLVERHDGQVPADMQALTALPGVGRKTANVVLGHALGVPGLPVDLHVMRVANRLAIAQAATPEEVERQLCAVLPPERWTLASDTMILHGRRICRPRPLCPECVALAHCPFGQALVASAAASAATAALDAALPPHRRPPARKAASGRPTRRAARR
jgi:endonuclease-3